MLKQQPWFTPDGGIEFEYVQACDEGLDASVLKDDFDAVSALPAGSPEKIKKACALYEKTGSLDKRAGYPYEEPSDLEGIVKCRPQKAELVKCDFGSEERFDRVYGAWLARCAGCLLGQPVEGWKRERINGLCVDTGNFPAGNYLSSDIPGEIAERYLVTDKTGKRTVNWINNVSCMPEDDDTNYTIIGLKILETYGRDFTSSDVAECWLQNLPMLHLCTAERVAYRNIACGVFPPASATYRNPFREWIGAQIRADFFGYISPGDPEKASEYAWRDASVSHVKNGVYGEMLVAAMLAAAAVSDDMQTVIRAGLSVIPDRSRLADKIREVIVLRERGVTYEQVADYIHSLYDEGREYDWCHTIPNAMIVVSALLYGEGTLENTLARALMCGFDTDCNCATAGSVIGMMLGAQALPAKWISPLHDTVISGVDGFGKISIYQLARRTMAFID